MSIIRDRGGRLAAAVLGALGLVCLAGCAEAEFKRVPASGTVTLDGQPLNVGVIHFYPDTAKGNNHRVDCLCPARDGKFTLQTMAVRGSDTGPGVPVGWYKVYLYTEPDVPIKIHERFTDPSKTPISIEVVENPAPGAYDVKFTSK